jgi:phospholipid/cholesterol/gamma-HCH transport system substrate-binding protein
MKKNVLETLVGAFVIVVTIGFAVYTAKTTNASVGADTYTLVAKFRKAQGLATGADVKISGVKVGVIRSIDLDTSTYMANVSLQISDSVKLPDDTSAKIDSEGLLGGSYLALQPGSSDYMLEEGDEIQFTQGAVNILDLVGKAIHGAAEE